MTMNLICRNVMAMMRFTVYRKCQCCYKPCFMNILELAEIQIFQWNLRTYNCMKLGGRRKVSVGDFFHHICFDRAWNRALQTLTNQFTTQPITINLAQSTETNLQSICLMTSTWVLCLMSVFILEVLFELKE